MGIAACLSPCKQASIRFRPLSSPTWIASTITIASSTSIPRTIIKAAIDISCTLIPNKYIAIKVSIIESGIAVEVTRAFFHPIPSSTTIITRIMPSNRLRKKR